MLLIGEKDVLPGLLVMIDHQDGHKCVKCLGELVHVKSSEIATVYWPINGNSEDLPLWLLKRYNVKVTK